ncbi:hypothetical protein HDV06_001762 [Boothiomyces sp. JEL0866]|nr:hypothetical protein HDV06_001762 [Boothiomyces sp. JEL0866]
MELDRDWIKQTRLLFCKRNEFPETKNMINSDGTLNQEYFQPPKGMVLTEPIVRQWTEKQKALLIQGISEHGIGQFRRISQSLLPEWTPQELRLKTIRLIGRQNLQLYKNWKGSEEDIKREYAQNKAIGQKFGCWKNNCLVYDDEGKVLNELKANKKQKIEHK